MRNIFVTCLILLSIMQPKAQDNVIDEVIWVIGDEAILRSEVEEQRLRAQYEGVKIDGDPYCRIPEEMAIQKLFLHQAELDSVVANENSVNTQVEMRMNYFISQIGSKEKLEEYFRKSASEIREDMYELVHNQMIIQQMQQQLVGDLKSTLLRYANFTKAYRKTVFLLFPHRLKYNLSQ